MSIMCIIHCRKSHLHNFNRDSHLHNYSKNCYPQKFAAETGTGISPTEYKEIEQMKKHHVYGKIALVLYNLMEKLESALCLWIVLYTHYLNFLIFVYFTNQITLKQTKA